MLRKARKAFRALVARHVDLVYATALRQVGDSGVAEEVTQKVFLALARKAPRLGGLETLAGWLHRTASLEAKARIRAELRRRRRENTAAERVAIECQGESVLDQVLPLLDEALLHLRDGDRVALVLRFLENRSLRQLADGWLDAQFSQSGAEPKTISLARKTDGSFSISVRSGGSWLSTGMPGEYAWQLTHHIPPHLLPFFNDLLEPKTQ